MDITELSAQAGLVFEQCDTNNKGFLTLDDFMILKRFLPMSEGDLTEIFHKMDRDRTLKLYRDEFEDGFQFFINKAQETCQKVGANGEERYNVYGMPEGMEEEFFFETIEQTGVKDAFDEVGVIKDVWDQIQRENPSMLPGFEKILTKVSSEIKKRKAECENIENAMKTQKIKQNEEIRRLYEEMENQIGLERKKLQDEELVKDRQRREELEKEIYEKDAVYQEILRQHEETMEQLKQLQQQHSDTAHEKERLAKERDILEHRLADSDLTLKECQHYIENLKEKSMEDRKLRAKAAIDLSEGIALERENLIKQLDDLRALNRKLKDEQDEKCLMFQKHPGQETIGEIINIDNSVNKKFVKLQLNLPNKINSMTPEQRRGSILSSYFSTVLPRTNSFSVDSDAENDVFAAPRPNRANISNLVKGASAPSPIDEEDDGKTSFKCDLKSESKDRTSPEGAAEVTMTKQDSKLPDAVYKVVFIGDSSVGKSTIQHQYVKSEFSPNISSTVGVDFQIKRVDTDTNKVILQLWDTAGQEKFRSVTKQYYRKADGVVIVYDATSVDSYINVRSWINYMEEEGISDEVVIILLANKVDLLSQEKKEKALTYLKKLADETNINIHKMVSGKTGEGIDEAFNELVQNLKILETASLENAVNFQETKSKRQIACCR